MLLIRCFRVTLHIMNTLKNVVLVCTVLFLFSKCKKNEFSAVPNVAVNLVLNINSPQFFALQGIGGYQYYFGGSKGLIIYRQDNDNFLAFDRHSPYQPEKNCIAEVDSSFITIVDPCSGSKWSLIDGSIVSGPTAAMLKQYQTNYDGIYLRIFN